jgi:hypothetical protein
MTVTLIADLYPGDCRDAEGNRPEGVPATAKLHVILTTTQIAIGWEAGAYGSNGSSISSVFIDVTEEETATATYNGGQVGPWTIARAGGCSCGKTLKRWNPYAGQAINQAARTTTARPDSYGLPTARNYSRT